MCAHGETIKVYIYVLASKKMIGTHDAETQNVKNIEAEPIAVSQVM